MDTNKTVGTEQRTTPRTKTPYGEVCKTVGEFIKEELEYFFSYDRTYTLNEVYYSFRKYLQSEIPNVDTHFLDLVLITCIFEKRINLSLKGEERLNKISDATILLSRHK